MSSINRMKATPMSLPSAKSAARGTSKDNSRNAVVNEAYNEILGRNANSTEVAGWANSGLSERDLAKSFFGSAEFQQKNFSSEQIIGKLYNFALDRQGEASGVSGWSAALKSGALSLNQIIDRFFDSSEYQQKKQ